MEWGRTLEAVVDLGAELGDEPVDVDCEELVQLVRGKQLVQQQVSDRLQPHADWSFTARGANIEFAVYVECKSPPEYNHPSRSRSRFSIL